MFLPLPVSHSVHGGDGAVGLSACWIEPLLADTVLADVPMSNYPVGQKYPWTDGPSTSAWSDTQCPVHAGIDMATAADGTHPTGWHSCIH